jgi:hypothetical protein
MNQPRMVGLIVCSIHQQTHTPTWKKQTVKEQLIKLLTNRPFQPFLIKMSDRTHDLYLLQVVSFERMPVVPV